jgi:hypothetical protein
MKNGFALSSLLVQLKRGLGLDHQMLTRLPASNDNVFPLKNGSYVKLSSRIEENHYTIKRNRGGKKQQNVD